VLPLQKELFDVIIIDEATQCDIASCLPSLQRAKKAVIAGDPNQLRHISFLSKAKQSEFLAKYDMAETMEYDYRNTSVLDLFSEKIASQQSVVFLNEHYRSLPEIISFSNKEFYDRRLKVMTEKPINYGHHPVVFNFCKDGKREEAGYNKSETEWIIKTIKEIVESDIMGTPSIGVLSPFRKQVDYISSEIMKHFPLQTIDKHNILVGTAHSFQGEERDIMFISLSLDTDSHSAAYRFMEIPNVFNVAITRAKSKQYIVHSIRKESLKSGSLLHKFFDFYSAGINNHCIDSNENYDHFAAAIIDRLSNMNLKVLSAVPIAGHTMDLVVTNGDKALGIDLIGFPGDFADAYPIERYKMFNRAGLKVIPITYSAWCESPEACIEHIQQNLT
jgi:superfamily I DNA and/or RNA helicase